MTEFKHSPEKEKNQKTHLWARGRFAKRFLKGRLSGDKKGGGVLEVSRGDACRFCQGLCMLNRNELQFPPCFGREGGHNGNFPCKRKKGAPAFENLKVGLPAGKGRKGAEEKCAWSIPKQRAPIVTADDLLSRCLVYVLLKPFFRKIILGRSQVCFVFFLVT